MKAFIIYQTYRTIKDRSYVFLFGRLENGENFVTINQFKPYFFIKEKDLPKARKISKEFTPEKTTFKTPQKEKVTKLILNIPSDVPKLRKKVEDHNIQCYEADIRFPQRFLIDNKIQGSMSIKGDYESEGQIDRIYRDPELKPIIWKPELTTLSIDIETDSKASQIYSISLYTKSFKKVLIVSKKKLKNAISCPDEEALLNLFVDKVLEIDPDIITGWHLIDFDFKVIKERMDVYNIPFQLGRDNTNCRLRIESSFFRDSKADFPGRQVLDGIHILKSSFIKLPDYKLDTAAKEILKDKKLIESGSKGEIIENYFKKQPQKLVDYNLKDAELVLKILNKTNTLNLTIERSLLTGMPLDRVAASIASLDSLYLKKARDRKYVLPSSTYGREVDQGVGGFVMESKPGIYDHILVFDFKSLYPSLIRTFNIDPLSLTKTGMKTPAGPKFTKEIGILPEIIQKLWEKRESFRKNKDEVGRYAIKILMNSFYGSIASPLSRLFNREVGNAITLNAQFFIKHTSELIRKKGYEVIYGDTDSIFVVSKLKSLKQAQELGKKLEKEINKYYTKWIKKEFNRFSTLELEFEKTYTKFLMPKLRKKEKGAKKRYAGLLNGKLDITGLEAVRGDWTPLAKQYQTELLERIFHNKEIIKYTRKLIEDVKKGKKDNLLIYKKSIRKNLEEYIKTTPPHVKAARKLKSLDSNIIKYVITTDGPEPIQKIKHKLDYNHYIEKQIKPIAESILDLFGKTFEEVEKGHKQASLFDY